MKKYSLLTSFFRYGLLLAMVLLGSLPTAVSATDINFLQNNNIFYYGGGGQTCNTVGAPYSTRLDIPSLTGSDNAEKIWNFLKSEGLPDESVAGIMGNLEQESGYNPEAVESNGIGFGIIQWSFERRNGHGRDKQNTGDEPIGGIEKAAKDAGVPVTDLGFQLKYMIQEAESAQLIDFNNLFSVFGVSSSDNVWDIQKKQTAVEKATTFWHDAFERSNDYTTHGNIQHRIDFADKAFEKFKGRSAAGNSSASSSGDNCSAAGSGDLIATLMEYAHPEYHENNYSGPVPPPKQAYLDVATKLQNEGKWVGGGNIPGDSNQAGYPAIDCGGFVSILLTQSGFEPDYNFGLDMDRGSSNQEYGQLPWAKRNWKFLGAGSQISTNDLQPGDVAYSNGHTFIYVGQVNGFGSLYASASYSWWRAPMAGGGFETVTSPDYVWYGRREGTPPAYGTTKMSDPIPAGNDVNPGHSVWGGGEE